MRKPTNGSLCHGDKLQLLQIKALLSQEGPSYKTKMFGHCTTIVWHLTVYKYKKGLS